MKSNWELRDRTEVFRDAVLKVEHRNFHYKKNGQVGKFTVISMKNWAVIVPVTADNNLILVRQFRVATGDVTYEFPGGALEIGEEADNGALRELTEETGYRGSLSLLSKMRPNPAFMDNFCYAYLAENCVKVKELELDPFEDLEPFEVTFERFDEMIKKGEIVHSITLAAWGAYKANRG